MKYILSGLCFLVFTSFSENIATGNIYLEIDNITQTGGMVWVGVYDSESNLMIQEKATLVQGERVEVATKMRVKLDDIPFGTYALALFHDENNNGYMDQNFIGIPIEPYAFSAPAPSKWRKPRFEEIKFDFNRQGQLLKAKLERW